MSEENGNFDLNLNQEDMKVNKWWVLLSGVLFTLLGFYFFNQPVAMIATLVFYLAFVEIISGIAGIIASIKKSSETKKYNLAISILDLIFGIILLASPILQITLVVFLPYFLSAWAFVRGGLVIYGTIKNKEIVKHFGLAITSGVLSIIAGIIILLSPVYSTIIITQTIGIFLIIMGVSAIFQFLLLVFKK